MPTVLVPKVIAAWKDDGTHDLPSPRYMNVSVRLQEKLSAGTGKNIPGSPKLYRSQVRLETQQPKTNKHNIKKG